MLDHFSLVAPLYERLAGFLDPAELREHLSLPTTGRLLDAGGGTGRVANALRGLAGVVVVTDFAPGMLRQAVDVHALPSVRSLVERLPFADGSFDRIIIVDAFHHFHDQRLAMLDLWRVLAPGGRLVIEEPNIEALPVKLVGVAERLALMRSRFVAPNDMAEMLRAVGAQVAVHSKHAFNSWIVADKVAS